jgi:preprotein translocase subunit SecE
MSEKKNPFAKIPKFLKEVRSELKKVTWPTKDETKSYTSVVLVTVAIATVAIWILDSAFVFITNLLILR